MPNRFHSIQSLKHKLTSARACLSSSLVKRSAAGPGPAAASDLQGGKPRLEGQHPLKAADFDFQFKNPQRVVDNPPFCPVDFHAGYPRKSDANFLEL